MPQTFGQILVNDLLPEDLRTREPLDRKELHQRLYTYARRDPAGAAEAIDKLRTLGHELSTTEGTSITLDDITPDYVRRNEITRPALTRLKRISSPTQRRQVIADTQERLQKASQKFGGTQGMMVRSGARGKPVQLARSFMATGGARQADGMAYPWLVHHSYSEGLRPSEIWATNVEARNNLIAANLAITEPGDFSKILVNNMGDQLVLSEDCGTTNGVPMSTDDANIIDRCLAQGVSGFRAGTVITPQVFSQLRKRKIRTVLVRSPMTCEHTEGVCQKCYGLDEKGKLHTLGTNIGIRSAQAMTEPLTQFVLSARHGVRPAGKDAMEIHGLKGFRQFLEIPRSFVNRAALASEAGKVTKIEKAPQGGFNVNIEESAHYVPPHLKPIVRVGQKVTAGDALSNGVPMPNEIVKYKGMGAGRQYMVDRLHDIYQNQGVDLDKRHFEVLARSHLNYVQVDEDPEDRFFPGEIVNYSTMLRQLRKDAETVSLDKAKGQILARGYLHHAAGTTLTPEIAKELSAHNIKRVDIAKTPPKISFVMQPITSSPLLNPDWMARLGHRRLKSSILQAAHFGETSDLHGKHPIPAYAYGREFGEGPKGKY